MYIYLFPIQQTYLQTCPKCSFVTDDIIVHFLIFCRANENLRNALLNRYITVFGLRFFINLRSESPREQCITLLRSAIMINNNAILNCWLMRYINSMVP